MKAEKLILGHISRYIRGSIEPIMCKNNEVLTWANWHQLRKFHENRFKTTTYIVRSYKPIYKSILTLRICDQEPPERKM